MDGQLSDVEMILLLLAGLYVFESSFWLRRGSAASTSLFGYFRPPAETGSFLGNEWGSVFIGGLAPFDATFVVDQVPVSFTDQGVLGYVGVCPLGARRLDQTEEWADWDEARTAQGVGRDVRIGRRVLARTRSERTAGFLAAALRRIGECGDGERGGRIREFLGSTVDVEALENRVRSWRESTVGLRVSATLLFVWIFPIGAAMHYGWIPNASTTSSLLGYLGGCVLIWAWTVVELYLAHRCLQPDAGRERVKTVLLACLTPAAAMRSADHLARLQLDIMHPWALAAVLRPGSVAFSVLQSTVNDLRFPILPVCPETPAAARAIEAGFREQMLEVLLAAAGKIGVSIDALDAPKLPNDPSSTCYCPRCLREFTEDGVCADCGDRPLTQFATGMESASH